MAASAGTVGSAVCVGCGAAVVGATTIGQPIYACGSWGGRATCIPAPRAIEDEMLDKVAAAVEALQHAERQMWGPDERPTIVVADVLAAIERIRRDDADEG